MCKEADLFKQYSTIIGVDEAGRGCLAGPVYAGAVMCNREQYEVLCSIPRLTDSKKLSAKNREKVLKDIRHLKIPFTFHAVDNFKIDEINILQASLLAMKSAVLELNHRLEESTLIAIDGNQNIDLPVPQSTIVKGDMKFKTIGAASIVAKVLRDQYMAELHESFPQYGYLKHKGYPSKFHREMIREHGITPFYRKTFKLL